MGKEKKKKKKEEKQKPQNGKSFTREDRPKGVSRREWDVARKKEGRDPYAKFFSDPKKEKKSKTSSIRQSSGKWDSSKESYDDFVRRTTNLPSQNLTPEEQKQADDFVAQFQGGQSKMPVNPVVQKLDPMSVIQQKQADQFTEDIKRVQNDITELRPDAGWEEAAQHLSQKGHDIKRGSLADAILNKTFNQNFNQYEKDVTRESQLSSQEQEEADSFIDSIKGKVTDKFQELQETGKKPFLTRLKEGAIRGIQGPFKTQTALDWTARPITRTAASTLAELQRQKELDPNLMGEAGRQIFGKEPIQSYSEGGKQIGETFGVKNPAAQAGISALLVGLDYLGYKGAKKKELVEQVLKKASIKKEATIIDPDIFKKQFNDYNPANHDKYSKMAKEKYAAALKEDKNPEVHFLAGGSGSGKSEIVLKKLAKEHDGIIYDGTLSNYDSAIEKIKQAETAGKDVVIDAILPKIETARQYSLRRELKTGRGVPLNDFVEKHTGFVDTLRKLTEDGYNIRLKDTRFSMTRAEAESVPFIDDPKKILAILEEVSYNKSNLERELQNVQLSEKTRRKILAQLETERRGQEAIRGTNAKNEYQYSGGYGESGSISQGRGTNTGGGIEEFISGKKTPAVEAGFNVSKLAEEAIKYTSPNEFAMGLSKKPALQKLANKEFPDFKDLENFYYKANQDQPISKQIDDYIEGKQFNNAQNIRPREGQSIPETRRPNLGLQRQDGVLSDQERPGIEQFPGNKGDKPANQSVSSYSDDNVIPSVNQKAPDLSTPEAKRAYKATTWEKVRTYVQDSWYSAKKLEKTGKRNESINPSEAQELYSGRVGARLENLKKEVETIDADIVKTGKNLGTDLKKEVNDYLQATHAPERNKIHGDGAAGMTNKEAKNVLSGISNSSSSKEVVRIANNIKKLNDQTLEILKDGGVIGEDTYSKLKKTYKNYVPLNRIMPEDDDVIQVLTGGKGLNVVGTGIKRAKGSSRQVADILTNTYANLGEAIARSEKNRVNLATLEFARNNKDLGLFEEIKPKAIGTSFDGEKPILEQINDPDVLKIRENGKPVYLKIKDEGLSKMYQAIGQERLPSALKSVEAITRFYSSLATRFNPEFVLSNKIRDLQEMMVNVSAKKGVDFGGAAKSGARDLASMKSVTEAMVGKDTEGARLYNQMRADGGTTGGMSLSTRKNLELDISAIEKINRSNSRKAVEMLVGGIEKWNTIFEDSTRLSVYKTALDRGMSRDQAALLAKNATLNFNKKGTAGPIINSLYMFSNASIQGTTNTLRAMKNPKVAAVISTLVGTATYTVNRWNDSVDPEWRDKVTEWDRNSNLVVMLPSDDGGANYATIPVAWGIKPIKVMADRFYDTTSGKGKGILGSAEDVLVSAIDAYNPIGGTDLISTMTPTALDMPVDLARNKSWSGSDIKPDWKEGLPKADQYFDSLKKSKFGEMLIGATGKVSESTGRKIDISPQDLNYVVDQLIGGGGRFIERSANTTSGIVKGEEIQSRDIPFWNRFVKERTEEEVKSGIERSGRSDVLEGFRKFQTGSQEQKNAIQEYLKNLPSDEDRQREAFILRDSGFDMKGISTSINSINIRSTYEKVDDLMKQGKVTEANKIIEGLSKEDEDRESFNRMRGNQKPDWYNPEKTKEATKELTNSKEPNLYDDYAKLQKEDPAKAKKFISSMDYPTYEKFKKSRTSARASHTRQFKSYLASDNPEEAVRYLEELGSEEKKRIEGIMTKPMRERYIEGKTKYQDANGKDKNFYMRGLEMKIRNTSATYQQSERAKIINELDSLDEAAYKGEISEEEYSKRISGLEVRLHSVENPGETISQSEPKTIKDYLGEGIREARDFIEKKIPFIENTSEKSAREYIFRNYNFTDEAKDLLRKETRIRTDADILEGAAGQEEPGYTDTISSVKGGGIGSTRLAVGFELKSDIIKSISKKIGTESEIKTDKSLDESVVAHELLHSYTRIQKDKFDYMNFNKDWDENWEDYPELQAVDEVMASTDIYNRIPQWNLASERFAYLGSSLSRNVGINGMPVFLRKYYKGLLN